MDRVLLAGAGRADALSAAAVLSKPNIRVTSAAAEVEFSPMSEPFTESAVLTARVTATSLLEGESPLPSFHKVCSAVACIIAAYSGNAHARGVVREPGQHPRYSVELEPHLVLDWAGLPGARTEGFGAGFRASIPLFHNGPIDTINNNMAISFGFDWVHGSRACARRPDPRFAWYDDCAIDSFWFPVALQWNFYLTDVISVFGEPGLSIVHYRWDRWGCWAPDYCDPDGNDTTLRPVLWGGARFLFTDNFGATVRLGFPSVTAGISLLL